MVAASAIAGERRCELEVLKDEIIGWSAASRYGVGRLVMDEKSGFGGEEERSGEQPNVEDQARAGCRTREKG